MLIRCVDCVLCTVYISHRVTRTVYISPRVTRHRYGTTYLTINEVRIGPNIRPWLIVVALPKSLFLGTYTKHRAQLDVLSFLFVALNAYFLSVIFATISRRVKKQRQHLRRMAVWDSGSKRFLRQTVWCFSARTRCSCCCPASAKHLLARQRRGVTRDRNNSEDGLNTVMEFENEAHHYPDHRGRVGSKGGSAATRDDSKSETYHEQDGATREHSVVGEVYDVPTSSSARRNGGKSSGSTTKKGRQR